MNPGIVRSLYLLIVSCLSGALASSVAMAQVPYVPTPNRVVVAMLELAKVGKDDVVYDLGSGDGRIVIAAVKDFGASRAVGVELDPELVALAERNARKAGVSDRVSFLQQNLFESDIRPATVVTLYLLPETNLLLRPKLLRELAPGTRIVSHSHDMGDWQPERTLKVRDHDGKLRRLHLWTVPPPKDRHPSPRGGRHRTIEHQSAGCAGRARRGKGMTSPSLIPAGGAGAKNTALPDASTAEKAMRRIWVCSF